MAIRVQRHANVSKQATLLDGLHEGMNHISNVKVHLKTRNRNVNILAYTLRHCHKRFVE